MISNQKLFSVGDFNFRLQHLLIIGVLLLSISINMLMRSGPASYGQELFEFDPFFNYRATEYVLDNGISSYLEWTDVKTWHPFGRDVSETSQVSLHVTSAILYQLFGFNTTLYDFTILLPLVLGSLTAVSVFAFVRVIGGTTAGLFAALIFSISLPIISRGLIGWFKSEPLGLFFGFLALYLFVSGIKINKGKISFLKLFAAGLFLSLGLSAWGGILFFLLIIALYYFTLPFIKHEKNFVLIAVGVFSLSLIVFSSLFERTTSLFYAKGIVAVIGYAGFTIILPTVFVIISEIIKKFSSEKTKIRNCLIFLTSIIISGIAIIYSGLVTLPSFRYLNAINPFLTNNDPLTDSVAEHATTSVTLSFSFLSIFIIFALIGIWFLFSKKTIIVKNNMRIFALISSLVAIYISSSFIRLEIFASVAVIILGSIGLTILLQKILEQNNHNLTKLVFPFVIIITFCFPIFLPEGNTFVDWTDFPPSVLSGAGLFPHYFSNDWIDATSWLKENTPEDAVIAAWWDYGYWITTLSERTTIIDNATLVDWQIAKMGLTFITTPEKSWHILNSHYTTDVSDYIDDETIKALGGTSEDEFLRDLQTSLLYKQELIESDIYQDLTIDDKNLVDNFIIQNGLPTCVTITKSEAKKMGDGTLEQSCNPLTKGMDADYVLINIIGERFFYDDIPLYTLEGGGDESKKHWFAQISKHQSSKFVQSDQISPTPYFMENTTLGKLIPFSIIKYVEINTGRTFDQYQDGLIPVYVNDIKLNDIDDPFFLVYASPSFYSNESGAFVSVLIYKINSDYQP
jgi:dolichyl-diphosphooligosaccharide--protein glycosyltransferase